MDNISNEHNLNDLCRTCLKKDNLVPLFKNNKIVNMLEICVRIQFNARNGLPKSICLTCLQNITNAYKFYEQCHKADKILKGYLVKQLNRPETQFDIGNLQENIVLIDEGKMCDNRENSQQENYMDESRITEEDPLKLEINDEIVVRNLNTIKNIISCSENSYNAVRISSDLKRNNSQHPDEEKYNLSNPPTIKQESDRYSDSGDASENNDSNSVDPKEHYIQQEDYLLTNMLFIKEEPQIDNEVDDEIDNEMKNDTEDILSVQLEVNENAENMILKDNCQQDSNADKQGPSDLRRKHSIYCLVPGCLSTYRRTPEKLFISLPNKRQGNRRKLWLKAMKRNENDISQKTNGYVCEDHFNLEEDMKNFLKWKLMGGRIFLKSNVVPHIFKCQKGRKRSLTLTKKQYATKKQHKEIIKSLLEETYPERSDVNIPKPEEETHDISYLETEHQAHFMAE